RTIWLVKKGAETGRVGAPDIVLTSNEGVTGTETGVVTFISDGVGISLRSTMQSENPQFQYQFSDEWSQTPDGNWTDWPEGGYEVTGTGRLFVREFVSGKQSDYASRDFHKIDIVTTDLGLVPEGQTDPVADEQVVKLAASGGFVLMGGYNTVKIGSQDMTDTDTRYVYIADAQGRAIKLVIEGGDGQAAIIDRYLDPQYFGTHQLNDITGVIRGMENGLPELWITSDFLPFLPSLAEGAGEPMEAQEAGELSFGDFNKKVVLRGMTFNPADNSFITSTGKKVKTYARLKTAPVYSTVMQLAKDVRYTVEGFVGYVGGEIMLFPTGAVKMPSLSAPNPITATEADVEAGYITVNVINDSFMVRPDKEGVREGTSCYYTFNDEEASREPVDMMADDPVIAVTPDDFIDGVCTLSVRYVRENINSRPVTVKFVHHDAVDVESIAAFKAMYGDDTEIPDPSVAANAGAVKYYRFKGEAEVRAITPRYLYLRDANAPADAKSAHSIMLYNANGWKAPVALRDREAAAPRELEPGDVITNFALIADRTELKNLRGYATGFSRTVQLVNAEPVGEDVLEGEAWQPEEIDVLSDPTFEFSEADRMVRYRVRNVQVTRDNNNVYKLVMPGNPELNINHVFEISEGWGTVYDSGQHYDIEGVVLRNGEPGKFALAFIDFSIKDVTAPAAPVLALDEGAEESDPTRFLTKATLTMTLPEGVDAAKATIWYTTDGSDPKQSGSDRRRYEAPIELTATTPVRAFVAVTGGLPGAVAEQVFTRTANDRRYIVNFLDQAEEGVPYHFTGNARIVAKGGEYLFVRGTQGHYLPIHVEDNAIDLEKMQEGYYLNDIVMEAHMINVGESRIVRGAHVAPKYAGAFGAPVEERPSTLVDDIALEPDVVTTLSVANARRYVKIMGVRLTGSEFTAAEEPSTHDTEWKLTTDKGAGEDIPVNHTILQPSFDWDAADQTAAAYYNITGFAMLDENGRIELWPLNVEKVKSSEPVRATFAGNITVDPVTADGLTTVEFYPSTMVTLSCPIADPSSATIYYYVSHDGSRPGSDARWNVYAQPFAVTSDSYITMYATAPGYEQSAPTYVDMKLGAPAGTVAFDVKAEPGVTTVTMTAAEGAEIYWTADDTKPQAQWIRYDEPVEFTSDARIQAYAKEGKKIGAVSSMYVMVAEKLPTDIEATGNSLQFSQEVTEEGYVEVTISVASPVAGGTIYYT
ncbi:MAG: chitobiase/beta-hexosaminidase C-terminal domain-containing protein, partial [Paramuribaculum sp.]|nr:chitobiase/beta-hexosaminidase C-terminal domain-containing protein [Paramuribaculum sp.]